MSIIIKNIKKNFGDFVAVDDISLQVKEGEFVGLLGPSGSGKTTLLRIIAGLEVQDEGEIFLEGVDATGQPIKERRIGFVFQHFALFKHMTVFENIAFGLRLKRPKIDEEEIKSKVNNLLQLIHLDGSGQKYPSELSGGQQQRVSLARVLAIEPKYMLLDEPFGSLDSKVRKELRRWLKKLHDSAKLTTIFVTHDQEEAMEISDKIAIIQKGRVEQLGTPHEIWENPANAFVFDFLGNYNTFFGYEEENGKLIINPDYIKENIKSLSSEKYIRALSRSHQVVMERSPDDTKYYLQVTVNLINRAGPLIKIEAVSHLGSFFLIDLETTKFESLKPQLDEPLWIRPEIYRSFSEKI
jgi:sulfate transport system ATP-binding protein